MYYDGRLGLCVWLHAKGRECGLALRPRVNSGPVCGAQFSTCYSLTLELPLFVGLPISLHKALMADRVYGNSNTAWLNPLSTVFFGGGLGADLFLLKRGQKQDCHVFWNV